MVEDLDGLSKPNTKAGRLQRACLELLREHEADDAIPTSGRFLFYELVDRGVVPKTNRKPDGSEARRTPAQDISDALTVLRENGLVPWDWIADETRSLTSWRYRDSVYRYASATCRRCRSRTTASSPQGTSTPWRPRRCARGRYSGC